MSSSPFRIAALASTSTSSLADLFATAPPSPSSAATPRHRLINLDSSLQQPKPLINLDQGPGSPNPPRKRQPINIRLEHPKHNRLRRNLDPARLGNAHERLAVHLAVPEQILQLALHLHEGPEELAQVMLRDVLVAAEARLERVEAVTRRGKAAIVEVVDRVDVGGEEREEAWDVNWRWRWRSGNIPWSSAVSDPLALASLAARLTSFLRSL